MVRHERRWRAHGAALVTAARLWSILRLRRTARLDESSRLVEENFACEGIDTSYAPRAVENSVVTATIVVGLDTGTRNVFPRAAGLTGAHDELP